MLPCRVRLKTIEGRRCSEIVANGVIALGEGANMPCTPEAVEHFQSNGVLFSEQGVKRGWCGYFRSEMSQNSLRMSWTVKR